MGRYRKSMKDSLREARLYGIEETTSYPPNEINKKKHAAYKDPKRGEHEIIKKEDDDPSVSDISKGLKIDKKTVKKVMGEKLDALISEGPNDQQIKTLKTIMEPHRGGKISADGGLKLIKMMDKFKRKEDLVDLFKADIPFVSALAAGRLIRDHGMSGSQVNKLKEELEEGYTDARTKAYREHRAKLDAARAKRLEQKKSKLSQKVQENIMDFNREIYLEENNMNVLKDIVLKKSAKPVKFKDGSMKVDLFTASAITQVYNKVNMDNKKKLENMVNGTKKQFQTMSGKIMKMVGK